MRFFYSILLSFCFLNSFSQNDTIRNKLSIGISPLLFLSPTSDIFYLEFQPTPKFSIEVGGGAYGSFWSPFDQKSGFTIRSGIKIYSNKTNSLSHGYHEFLVFYRQIEYENEYYYNENEYSFYKTRFLPENGPIVIEKKGNETKNVISVEWLRGKKNFLGKAKNFVIEYYGGFGIRAKIHEITITSVRGVSMPYTGLVPPFKEEIIHVLPTFHLGIKLATN